MTGAELLARAAVLLQDAGNVRWPLPELVDWINDGQRAVVLAKPSANAQTVILELVYGTKQSLTDATHLALLRLPRNIKTADPLAGGRAIRPTTREVLDTSLPTWHDPIEAPYKTEVRQYVYDEASPREFYVYPGNLATAGQNLVEALVSVLPTPLTASGDVNDIASYSANLALPEPWPIAVLDYVLFRAFGKDSMEGDATRSQTHFQAFAVAVGGKIQAEAANSPNARARIATT